MNQDTDGGGGSVPPLDQVDGQSDVFRPAPSDSGPPNPLDAAMVDFDQSLIVPLDMGVQDQPVFHWRIFLEQWCWQVLFPLSLPFIFLFRGYNAVINMRYLPSKDQIYVSAFQWLLAGSVLGMIILFPFTGYDWSYHGQKWDSMFYFFAGELALALVGTLFQRSAVATKYSYLPLREYSYLMTRRVTFESLQGDQIVNAWLNLADNAFGVLDRELSKAQKRLGIDANKVYLHLTASKLKYLEAETCTLESVGCVAEDVPEEELVGYLQANQQRGSSTFSHQEHLSKVEGAILGVQSSEEDEAEDSLDSSFDSSAPMMGPEMETKVAPLRTLSSNAAGSKVLASPLAANKRVSKALKQAAAGLRQASISPGQLAFPSAGPADSRWSKRYLHRKAAAAKDPGEEPEAWKRISVYALAKLLVVSGSRSQQKLRERVGYILFFVCLAGCFINVIIRAASGLPAFGSNGVQTAFFILSIYSSGWFSLIYSNYLFVAFVDVQRRSESLKKLGELAMLSSASQLRLVASSTEPAAPASSSAGLLSRAQSYRQKRNTAIFVGADTRGRAVPSVKIEMAPLSSTPPLGARKEGQVGPGTFGRTSSTAEVTMAINPLSLHASGAAKSGNDTAAPTPSLPTPPPRKGAAVIPLDNCENVVAWLMTRRMLRAFGLRYVARLTAYTGQGVVLTLLILFSVLAVSLQGLGPTLGPVAIGLGANALFYLLIFSFFILLLLLYAAEGNLQAVHDQGTLTARGLEAKQAAAVLRRTGFEEEAEECQEVAGVLKSVCDLLKLEGELDPIRVLGLRATYQLLGSIAISTISAALSAVNLLRTSFAPT